MCVCVSCDIWPTVIQHTAIFLTVPFQRERRHLGLRDVIQTVVQSCIHSPCIYISYLYCVSQTVLTISRLWDIYLKPSNVHSKLATRYALLNVKQMTPSLLPICEDWFSSTDKVMKRHNYATNSSLGFGNAFRSSPLTVVGSLPLLHPGLGRRPQPWSMICSASGIKSWLAGITFQSPKGSVFMWKPAVLYVLAKAWGSLLFNLPHHRSPQNLASGRGLDQLPETALVWSAISSGFPEPSPATEYGG